MKEIKTLERLEQWVENKKIYIYGAGKICEELLGEMERRDMLDFVRGIFVTNVSGNAARLHGIPVTSFEQSPITQDIHVLIAVMPQYRNEIISKLRNAGIRDIAVLSESFGKISDSRVREKKTALIQKICDASRKTAGIIGNRENEPKDVLFLTPPYWDAYAPFSAVPSLVAKLKEEGFSAAQYDIGIHCIHHLMNVKWKKTAKFCLSRTFYERNIKDYKNNPYGNYEEYRDDMWFFGGDHYDVERVKASYIGLNPVQKRVVDSFHYYIYLEDIADIDFDRCLDIGEAVDQWNPINMLETLYKGKLLQIFQDIPKVIGISVTSTQQFIPGCILAQMFRMCRPDAKIILGGSCADLFIKSSYQNKGDIKKFFDYIIIGEGETAITGLLRHIKQGKSLENVPNLAFIDESHQVVYTDTLIEDVDKLPLPSYYGLDLELYLSPHTILPYQASRGCHYGHCAFCDHDEKYRHHYRNKGADKVVKELLLLAEKYDVNNFQFVDEAIRPDCFEELIEEMDRHSEFERIKWFYYSRVSRRYNEDLLHKAKRNGCEMVMFGVETFNQRLLSFIKKGINAETSRYCLKLFHKCEIKTYAWLMCNLPSETVEEARGDLQAVKEMSEYIDAFFVGPFSLRRNTDMFEAPERFNIIEIDENDGRLFISHLEGKKIDKDRMLEFYEAEYAGYQRQHFATGNRYTLFFE